MGIVAGLSAAAAGASLGSTLSNAFSGPGGAGGFYGGSAPPPAYIPTGQPQADTQYQDLLGSLATINQQQQPYVANLQANPYAAQAQTGANTAAAYGTNTLAPSLAGYGANLGTAGTNILNTAFDPQGALYARTQQQTLDQQNTVNAMAGVANTPYGAGVTGNTLANFNINWQAQQLAKQLKGIQGAGSAYGGAGGLGGTAESLYGTSAGLPYSTYAGQQQDALQALSTGQGLDQNTLNALAAYLKLGQSATGVGQQGAAQNFANNQAIGQQVGQALGGLSNLGSLFGGGSSPAYGNNYASTVDALNSTGYYGPTDANGGLLYG